MDFEVATVNQLEGVARALLQMRSYGNVFAIYGPMGAGKTTLIKSLCHQLGVSDEVNSPTFSIVNEYLTEHKESVFHFDFYRINKIEEAYDIGYENYFYSNSLCFIEWPEKIEQLLPKNHVYVKIKVNPDSESRIIHCGINN